MLIIGGVGQLYGAFIGVPLYMIAQDRFSTIDPVFWYFWIGLFLIFVVVFTVRSSQSTPVTFEQKSSRKVGSSRKKLATARVCALSSNSDG